MNDTKIALIILGVLTALSLLLGVLFPTGKIMFLIPGYNAANEEEKKQYNEKKLCWFSSAFMLLAACSFILIGFGIYRDLEAAVTYGGVLAVTLITLTLIYTKTKRRFMRK